MKVIKASINMSAFHVRVVHVFVMLKKESIYTKHLWNTFIKSFFLYFFLSLYLYLYFLNEELNLVFLPNLGAQIRCAQNRYTALQTDVKYPLILKFLQIFSAPLLRWTNEGSFKNVIKILKIYSLKRSNNFDSLYNICRRFLKIFHVFLLKLTS